MQALNLIAICSMIMLSTTARADLAVSCICNSNWDVNLYWVEGDKIYTGVCDTDTTLFNRETCNNRVQVAGLEYFLGCLNYQYELPLNKVNKRQTETYVKLQQTESRINQLLAGEVPDVPTDDVEAQLEIAEQQRGELVLTITSIEDQIARIEQDLGSNADPDLVNQLALLGESLAARQDELAEKDRLIDRLRDNLLDAYATLAQQRDFQELTSIRNRLARELAGANASKLEFLNKWAFARNETRKIFDKFYTWEILGYSRQANQQATFASHVEFSFDQSYENDQDNGN